MAGPDLSSGRVPLDRSAAEYTPEIDNIDRGYIHTWNVAFERRLPYDVSVDVAYVGAKGVGGYAGLDINAPLTLGGGDASRPYASMGRIQPIWSWGARLPTKYQSLQVAFNKPFTRGFMFKGAYTLSKAMNYGTDADGRATLSWNTPSELDRNWSPAGFDRRHNFQMGFAWALPGQSVDGSYNSIGHAIFGDWQLNGVIAAFTGSPFTMGASGTVLNTPQNTQTADQVGDYNDPRQHRQRGEVVRYRVLRPADRRPLRQHGPEPVLRSWRVDDGPVDLPFLRSGRPAASRSARSGQQHLQPPGVRQSERDHDVRNVRTDHRLRAGWRLLHRTAVPGRRPLHVLTSDPRRACERGGDSPRAPAPHCQAPDARPRFHPSPRNPRGCLAGAVNAAAPCRGWPSRRFRPPRAMPCRSSTRKPRRARPTPVPWVHSAGFFTPGSSGTPRTRPMNAPPPWRHQTSTGTISMRSCCRGWRVTMPRPARSRRALAARPDYLPARLRLAEVLLEAGDLAQSEQLFVPLTAIAATEPAAEVGLGRINAARGRARGGHSPLRARARTVSRAWRRSLRAGASLPRGRPHRRRRARRRGARPLRRALAATRRSRAGLRHLAA